MTGGASRAVRGLGRRAALVAVAAAGAARAAAAQVPAPPNLPAPGPGPTVKPTAPGPSGPTRADSADARREGRRAPVACRGEPISEVVVLPQPPLGAKVPSRRLQRLERLQRRVTALHAVTRPSIIRRFLLLGPGDPCDELRRSESERILRAQPYLVDARVLAYDDGRGGVRLEVETRDEFSVVADVAAFTGGGAPPVTFVRLGEANLMGRAVSATGEWRDNGLGYRDGGAVRLSHYQLFGRPYQLVALGERRGLGGQWGVDVSHPFYTDIQRVAWRVSSGRGLDFLELVRPWPTRNAMFYDRANANVGGIVRVGTPGRLSLFGGSLSYERAATRDLTPVLARGGVAVDSGPPLGFVPGERYPSQMAVRANALWGVRAVDFVRVAGFETLTGVQDVRRGFQLSTMLGRSLAVLGTRDDDYFVQGTLYGGLGGARSFLAAEARAETRHDNTADEWRGTVATGRAVWYRVPNDRWRTLASVEYSGVWRPRIPAQLQLGVREAGVRGYAGAREAGSARVVARMEARRVIGALRNFGELGAAAFADAGRLWAGDAPYGVNTPLRASVGVGALGAFPRGSRRLWRLDVARGFTAVPGAPRFALILENRDLTRFFWREPRDVEVARERASPVSVFNWP